MDHSQKFQFSECRKPDRAAPPPVLGVYQASIAAASPAGFALAADEHHIRRRRDNDVLRKCVHTSTIEGTVFLQCILIEQDVPAQIVFQNSLVLQQDELLLWIAVGLNTYNSHHAGLDLETR